MKKTRLIRQQLDVSLRRFRPVVGVNTPPKGWIRAVRDAMGMKARQLAGQLGVAQQRVALIEKAELTGSVTLKTMRRVAEKLDCVFVYGFIPRTSLEDTVRRKVRQVAEKRLARASQTMSLEDQGLKGAENKKILADTVRELIDELPPNLWDD